jgi:hypothetical protein
VEAFASTSNSAWRLLFLSFHFTGGSSCSCGNAYVSVVGGLVERILVFGFTFNEFAAHSVLDE